MIFLYNCNWYVQKRLFPTFWMLNHTRVGKERKPIWPNSVGTLLRLNRDLHWHISECHIWRRVWASNKRTLTLVAINVSSHFGYFKYWCVSLYVTHKCVWSRVPVLNFQLNEKKLFSRIKNQLRWAKGQLHIDFQFSIRNSSLLPI